MRLTVRDVVPFRQKDDIENMLVCWEASWHDWIQNETHIDALREANERIYAYYSYLETGEPQDAIPRIAFTFAGMLRMWWRGFSLDFPNNTCVLAYVSKRAFAQTLYIFTLGKTTMKAHLIIRRLPVSRLPSKWVSH